MNKNDLDEFEKDLAEFALKWSALRIKVSTYYFDRDYHRGEDNQLHLMNEKAVVRALGKVTKVPIGPNEKFSTYEEAAEATKKYWQEYYRKVRAKRTDKERLIEARRQKRYRQRRKLEKQEFRERQ